MVKKILKYFLILLGVAAVFFAALLYWLRERVFEEREQEKRYIIEIINAHSEITDITGIISDIERKFIRPETENSLEKERITFTGNLGSAVIEGVRKQSKDAITIDGAITFNGQNFPINFTYPEGKTEFNHRIDWKIDPQIKISN